MLMLKYFKFKTVFNLGKTETLKTLLDTNLGQPALNLPSLMKVIRLKIDLKKSLPT